MLLKLLNALPDHPLKKNEILDIFYNGLTDASRDYLDSCAGSIFRERTPDEAEILLNNMLKNENNWTLPQPTPKPTPKKRGVVTSYLVHALECASCFLLTRKLKWGRQNPPAPL